jgi:hypothetical protein
MLSLHLLTTVALVWRRKKTFTWRAQQIRARWAPVLGVAVGGKTTQLADKAERGKRGEPVKPLARIRYQAQLTFLRTDDHIGALGAVFDQRGHTGASTLFGWIELSDRLWLDHRLTVLNRSLLIRRQGERDRSSYQFPHDGFQGTDPPFDAVVSLLEQNQCQSSQVVGKLDHSGFQEGKLLQKTDVFLGSGRRGVHRWIWWGIGIPGSSLCMPSF